MSCTIPGVTSTPPDAPGRHPDPLWAILVGVLAGIVLAILDRPRTGMWLVAGTLAVAAVARLVLRRGAAGSLVVRSREVDVLALVALAAAIGVLAAVSPLQR
jgi:TctA family transporter